MAEVAVEFDGADPIRPARQETLEWMRQRMLSLKDELALLGVSVELPEAGEEELQLLRHIVWRDR